MFTDKRNVLLAVSLMKAHGVKQIVLCPGSRNIPLVQAFVADDEFQCHQITDERSAAFFAIGLSLHGGKPAAICCTSGSALLNIHPAVAEAFYQQVPLVVISADRPAAWIGQMDGQTLPQPNVFADLCKMSVTLPEIDGSQESEWYCNRLLNEALMAVNHRGKGPVHINIPISEPFFSFPTEQLPDARVITRYVGLNVYDREYSDLISRMNKYSKRMVVAGQMNLIYLFERKINKLLYKHFVWFAEHIGNKAVPGVPIKNFDVLIHGLTPKQKEDLRPDLLVTYGGHIVSARLKKFLRAFPPKEHWHVSKDGKAVDLYGCLTSVIEMDPFEFLEKIAFLLPNNSPSYPRVWEDLSKQVPAAEFEYSAMSAIGSLIESLPSESALHLANSSSVRYAQLFSVKDGVEVCCNRGINGIEGSLSTAMGYALMSAKPNFVVIGDLSFFYDMSIIAHDAIRSNVRILVLNNGGGEIFEALPGLNLNEDTARYVKANHKHSAKAWAEGNGFSYSSAKKAEELESGIASLTDVATERNSPMLLEVFTDPKQDVALLKQYFRTININESCKQQETGQQSKNMKK